MKFSKKSLICTLVISLLLAFPMGVYAQSEPIHVSFNGQQMAFAVDPQIMSGRTMVPMRAIFEKLGYEVDWNASEKMVTGTKADSRVTLKIDSDAAEINGQPATLDVPAKLVGGSTLVPLRFVSESAGAKVFWDPKLREVRIVNPGVIAAGYLKEINAIGARPAGTEAEAKMADWIKMNLEEMGYTVTVEPFAYDSDGAKGNSQNLIAVKSGKTDQTVVLGAHYDSVDVGKGVDDNGSGVSALLEAAQVYRNVDTPQTIQFVFFGAEEVGLCGSDYHVSKMTPEALKKITVMMNYDSLVAGDHAYVYGNAGEMGKYRDHALAAAKAEKLALITQPGENPEYPAGTTGDFSDHVAYKYADVPYLYFESTNWTLGEKDGYTQVDVKLGADGEIWHTQYDAMDYISTNFPGRIEERLHTVLTITEDFLQEDLSAL